MTDQPSSWGKNPSTHPTVIASKLSPSKLSPRSYPGFLSLFLQQHLSCEFVSVIRYAHPPSYPLLHISLKLILSVHQQEPYVLAINILTHFHTHFGVSAVPFHLTIVCYSKAHVTHRTTTHTPPAHLHRLFQPTTPRICLQMEIANISATTPSFGSAKNLALNQTHKKTELPSEAATSAAAVPNLSVCKRGSGAAASTVVVGCCNHPRYLQPRHSN